MSGTEQTINIDGQIKSLLADAEKILIVSHIRPDGDALGALLALGLALRAKGKQVQTVLSDPPPVSFKHLPGFKHVQRKASPPWDLSISVDASDLPRTGEALSGTVPDICLDHHITNQGFGRVNLIEPQAEAACALLAEHMPRWDLAITRPVAECLLTGIIVDTLGFRTPNVRPALMCLAAELMATGADMAELYRLGLVTKTYAEARLWGAGLSRLEREDGMIWTRLYQADRTESGYHGNDDADLINQLTTINSDVALLFNEQKRGSVKVSWRARAGLDVSGIALSFGGGGHPAAAGADIPGTMDEVSEDVLGRTRAWLREQKAGKAQP